MGIPPPSRQPAPISNGPTTECREYRPLGHACHPAYEVRDATDDSGKLRLDDPWHFASEIRARTPDDAAEKFAEESDQTGDYYLSRSESNKIVVEVRLASDHTRVSRFRCSASHSVSYSAAPVEADDATIEISP